jgi:hypothetical protein
MIWKCLGHDGIQPWEMTMLDNQLDALKYISAEPPTPDVYRAGVLGWPIKNPIFGGKGCHKLYYCLYVIRASGIVRITMMHATIKESDVLQSGVLVLMQVFGKCHWIFQKSE